MTARTDCRNCGGDGFTAEPRPSAMHTSDPNCPACKGTGKEPAAVGPRCEVCGISIVPDYGRCTNRRCRDCHAKHCTSGGVTSPGHGRGTVATPFATKGE